MKYTLWVAAPADIKSSGVKLSGHFETYDDLKNAFNSDSGNDLRGYDFFQVFDTDTNEVFAQGMTNEYLHEIDKARNNQ